MKSRDEMVKSLLERRGKYEIEQKRKKKQITRVAVAVLCVCVAGAVGFGVKGKIKPEPPAKNADDALYPGIKDTFDESRGESPDNPKTNEKTVVNKIGEVPSSKFNICLFDEDFVKMTREEMAEYYGVNYIPEVPSDLKLWKSEDTGIYKRNSGTGEVYFDCDILNYSNGDYTREVSLEVSKKFPIASDYTAFDKTAEKSVINNTEVLIGVTESGYYCAEFEYKNIGIRLVARGLTQSEFETVISSITKR